MLHFNIDRTKPLRLISNMVIILPISHNINFRKQSFGILMLSLFNMSYLTLFGL